MAHRPLFLFYDIQAWFRSDFRAGVPLTNCRLIQCTVEMTRCRLDRTYLEALGAAALSPGDADAGEVEALREEVDSLYAEIFPVVQMSVENQFLRPAEKRVRGREARALGNSAVAIDYVGSTAPSCFYLTTAPAMGGEC